MMMMKILSADGEASNERPRRIISEFHCSGRHHQNLYSFTPADCTAVLVLVLLVIMPTTSEHAQRGDDYYHHHENDGDDDDHKPKHHQKYVNNIDN